MSNGDAHCVYQCVYGHDHSSSSLLISGQADSQATRLKSQKEVND